MSRAYFFSRIAPAATAGSSIRAPLKWGSNSQVLVNRLRVWEQTIAEWEGNRAAAAKRARVVR